MSDGLAGGSFRDFKLVDDGAEAKGLLSEGSRLKSAVMFWTPGQTHVLRASFGKHEPMERMFYIELAKKTPIDGFLGDHSRGLFTECLFSIGLVSAHVFFKAKFHRQDPSGLRFFEPDAMYKVQRRKNLRYTFSDKERPTLSIGDRKRPILDISAGGLCFFATEQEAKFYLTGSKVQTCSFRLGERMLVFDAEIRHSFQAVKLEGHGAGMRIGAQFQRIAPADDQYISWFVFEETRKLLSKVL